MIFLTVLFPLAYNVVLSFSNMSLSNFHDWEIVGLANYQSMLAGGEARHFWGLFLKTAFWTAVNVFFHVSLGVLLAVVINGPVRGKSIYRVLLIIPWAVPAYITALTWRGMFDYEFGAVNHLIIAANHYLPEVLQLPVLDWLKTAGPAFAACIVANVWLGFPFMMVIALGGLQGIPAEMYEAASIDGASRLRQFWEHYRSYAQAGADAGGDAGGDLDLQQPERGVARLQRRRAERQDAHPGLLRLQGGVQPVPVRSGGGAVDGDLFHPARLLAGLPSGGEGYGECVWVKRLASGY